MYSRRHAYCNLVTTFSISPGLLDRAGQSKDKGSEGEGVDAGWDTLNRAIMLKIRRKGNCSK